MKFTRFQGIRKYDIGPVPTNHAKNPFAKTAAARTEKPPLGGSFSLALFPTWKTRPSDPSGKVTAFAANGPVPLRRTADGRRYAFDLKSNSAVLVVFEM